MACNTALISGALGIFGTTVGAFLGHYLSKTWQREQWLLDNKRQEYRELLAALSLAYLTLMKVGISRSGLVISTPDPSPAEDEAFRVLHDRIFVADEIQKKELFGRWTKALKRFTGGEDTVTQFTENYKAMQETVILLATRSVASR